MSGGERAYEKRNRKMEKNVLIFFLGIIYSEELFFYMDLCLPTTPLTIHRATHDDVEDVVKLRGSVVENALRPMSRENIEQVIGEFYLGKIEDTPIGCLRLFVVESVTNTLELGSLVVLWDYRGRWYCRTLIEFGENFARVRESELILVTDNQQLEGAITANGWHQTDKKKFDARREQSPRKRLYTIDLTSPREKILTKPDSRI